jgi:hypothetical protein
LQVSNVGRDEPTLRPAIESYAPDIPTSAPSESYGNGRCLTASSILYTRAQRVELPNSDLLPPLHVASVTTAANQRSSIRKERGHNTFVCIVD